MAPNSADSSASIFNGFCPHLLVASSQITMSVGQLNCCWPSPAQSFLASGLVETFDQDFFLLDMYVFEKWGLLLAKGKGLSFCEGATFDAPKI
jgi:hypothetical protein